MLPALVRHVLYPLHEHLLGRPTLRFLRELEESQWLSPCQLRVIQLQKLRDLLQHAASNTTFYRERFRAASLDPQADDLLADITRLPLLDKAQIAASLSAMKWSQSPGGLTEAHTGGSSGEPLRFFVDRRRQAYDQAARLRAYRWFGVNLGSRELYLWGSPIESARSDRLRRWRDGLTNHRLLSAFNMSPQRMDAYLDALQRFQPACLYGYPSSLALLAEHAIARGRPLRLPKLKAIFVTGEVCYPHHRETLRSYFGVPVVSGYGSREAGFIAHECPAGNMHITAENVIVEVMPARVGCADHASASDARSEEQPAPPTGEIVITHLDAYGMPLIRYRTGDVGRLKPGRCACGRGLPMLDVVAGRTTDFIHLPSGVIKHALSVIYPLRSMSGVRQFRVTQHADYSVKVQIVPVCDDLISPARVARRLHPVLGEDIDIEVECVTHIPSAESGKYRYVISHVRPLRAPSIHPENHHA